MIPWLLIGLSAGPATVTHHPVLALTAYARHRTDITARASRETPFLVRALPTEEEET